MHTASPFLDQHRRPTPARGCLYQSFSHVKPVGRLTAADPWGEKSIVDSNKLLPDTPLTAMNGGVHEADGVLGRHRAVGWEEGCLPVFRPTEISLAIRKGFQTPQIFPQRASTETATLLVICPGETTSRYTHTVPQYSHQPHHPPHVRIWISYLQHRWFVLSAGWKLLLLKTTPASLKRVYFVSYYSYNNFKDIPGKGNNWTFCMF